MEAFRDESALVIRDLARRLFGTTLSRVIVEYPPSPGMGDLASPAAFELAKQLRRKPRAIADEMAAAFPRLPWLRRVEAAGAGYLNLHVDRGEALRALAREVQSAGAPRVGAPVIVEHTNINPNKAAHIGHVRNAVLGDTLARLLRFLGHRVEVQNYIDDTGVQVADVLIGFREILGWGLEQVQAIRDPVDRFCWDLYARVTEMYEKDPGRRSLQPAMLKALEEGRGEVGALARWLTRRIVGCHLDTMRRLGVTYDFLPWEGHILAGRFWEAAFERLKERRVIVRVETGERAGCWVMALEGERFADLKESEKIIVRSNGTVTYVGKDIAYQMWKFGLLPIDFKFEIFQEDPQGHRVWSSTEGPGVEPHPPFGKAERVYNVIDVRQSYLQAIVAEGLRSLGYHDQADRSIHFAYEMVALTPRAAGQLGVALAEEDRGRAYIGMSGRKGLGIKADDLLDAVEERALREVRARHADLAPGEASRLAREIAVGAVRYFMLKFTRNKVLAFDFDDALSFEGETGPYLQYAVVRAAGIFEKLAAGGGPSPEEAGRLAETASFDLPEGQDAEEHWGLLVQIARFQEHVGQAVASLELSLLAKYGFTLAQRFNTFYHRYPVMKEPDPVWRRARIVLTWLFMAQMRRTLGLMGIPVPESM